MIDTCQANTMLSKLYSPNILATGSSQINENSYSYENDDDLGISVIDTFTHYILEFMEGINKTSQTSMQDLFDIYEPRKIRSTAGVRSDLFQRPLSKTLITDFFGGVAQAELVSDTLTEDDYSYDEELITPPPTSEGIFTPENSTLQYPCQTPDRKGASNYLRAWGGLASIGVLVAFVTISRK